MDSQKEKIRALIVDDMAIARKRVRRFLSTDAEIEIVGECANGEEAIAAIAALDPELVFLDVQMPEADGFAVIDAVGSEAMPVVIFLTAFDEFALKAFECHALDYLLKPFDRARFDAALRRAKTQVIRLRAQTQNEAQEARLLGLLQDLRGGSAPAKRLLVKSAGRLLLLLTEEIDIIETAGNYLRIKAGNETHLIRERLHHLESRLDPQRFVRIHRATIVNIEKVKALVPLGNGDHQVRLADGSSQTLSRTYRDDFFQRFGAAGL